MDDPRLQTAPNVWMSTTRPNGKPHLIPIWFIWLNDRFYICTESKSVKIQNLRHNAGISVALEDGNKPVIAEGKAVLIETSFPEAVRQAFISKYKWDISADPGSGQHTLIEIAPEKWLKWEP